VNILQLINRIIFALLIFWFAQSRILFSFTEDTITNNKLIEAFAHEKEGKYEESISILKIELNRENNISIKLQIIKQIGLNYWNLGNINESLEYYQIAAHQANKYSRKTDIASLEQYLEIYRYYNLGKQFRSQRRLNDSKLCFEKAIIISNNLNSNEHKIKCQRQLGSLYYELNDKINYYKLNMEAYNSAKAINLKREEEYCAYNLGIYFQNIGDYADAIDFYLISYKLAMQFSDESDKSSCLMSIGTVYLELGLLDKSLDYLLRALHIDERVGDNNQIAMDLNNIGITYRMKGVSNHSQKDFNSSLYYYYRAYDLAIKSNNIKLELTILNNIGSVLTNLNKNYDALDYFDKVLSLSAKYGYYDLLTNALNNLGIVHANLGNYEISIKYYLRSIEIAQKYQSGKSLWEAYFELGNSYKNQDKIDLALNNYNKSITIIENIRTKIDLEEYKASYLGSNKRLDVFYSIIDLLVSAHRLHPNHKYDQDSLHYLERAKARAFLDSLEISNIDIDGTINFKLINREKEILNDISRLYLKLLNAGLPPKQIANLNDELKKKEEDYDILKRNIMTANSEYAGLKFPYIITFHDARNLLPNSNTAFITYCLGKATGYAFAVTKKGLKLFDIPSSQQLQIKVADYLRGLTDKDNLNIGISHELYNILVSPGLDKNIKSIIICPDGILNFLPFETLKCSDAKDDWLISRYSISYTPSLSSLRELISRKRRINPGLSKYIFLVGDPDYGDHKADLILQSNSLEGFYSGTPLKLGRLEHSRLELTKIAALFNKSKTFSLYGQEASEPLIKYQNLNGYKILHFAAHTLIDDKNPGRSSIILALNQNREEDGFLQMREIFNLKMNADLVTLSACETGLGQLIHGEGIVGLNRAFFFAGANAVLMSLWAVHDESTAQLMERFYVHLKKGSSISAALRSAKIEMISSKNLSHPFYWAGFIVTGNANKVIFPNRWTAWILFIIFILGTITVSLAVLNKIRKIS
jgi:CHAT domain-containing protein